MRGETVGTADDELVNCGQSSRAASTQEEEKKDGRELVMMVK